MTDTKSLYETDYALWLDRTIGDLKAKRLEAIDWENLIEEVSSLGRSQRHELKSRLTTLLEHGLKRKYVDSPYDFRGWVDTLIREQDELQNCLQDSPSLINYWSEIFLYCYRSAKKRLTLNKNYSKYTFPEECPFPQDPDRLLNDTFWE